MNQLFIVNYKNEQSFLLSDLENIKKSVENNKYNNWTDFQKKIRSDMPIEYYEYKAEIFDNTYSKAIENIKSLSINDYQVKKLDINIYDKLKNINVDQIGFVESVLDIDFPLNIYKVKRLNCSGKTVNGEINFEKYNQLEEIHILNYNKSIKFKGKSNNVSCITFWYFNPSDKSIENIIQTFPNLKKIVINHTNINSIDCLEALKNLKTLEISMASNISDISVLKKFSKLENLRFENCKRINEIDFLSLTEEQVYRFKKYKILEY
jgi:hypothetical protein